MEMIITCDGQVRAIYGEEVPLETLGIVHIRRASHVEPTIEGQWSVDLAPLGGATLGPFRKRSQALEAEHDWLRAHWLHTPSEYPVRKEDA